MSMFDGGDEERPAIPAWAVLASLLDRLALLWPYRRRICVVTTATGVLTFLPLLLVPNRYTARAVLNPPDMSPVSGLTLLLGAKSAAKSAVGAQVGGLLGLSDSGELYVQTMQTRRIQDDLIRRFDLTAVYGTKTPEATRKALAADSRFVVDRKSNLISIEVTDRDSRRAADLANGYADELGKNDMTMASDAGRREREYFEVQLQQAQQKLGASARTLSEFGKANAAVDIDSAGKGLSDSVAAIQGQIIATEASLKGMRAIYTDGNESVRQTEAQLTELKRQMAELAGPAKLQSDGKADPGAPTLAHMWGTAPSYLEKYEDVKVQTAIVETLAEQYEIAKLREAREISDVQLLDPAIPPERKSGPHRALMALCLSAIAFLTCCGYILVGHWWTTLPSDNPWKRIIAPKLRLFTGGQSNKFNDPGSPIGGDSGY